MSFLLIFLFVLELNLPGNPERAPKFNILCIHVQNGCQNFLPKTDLYMKVQNKGVNYQKDPKLNYKFKKAAQFLIFMLSFISCGASPESTQVM